MKKITLESLLSHLPNASDYNSQYQTIRKMIEEGKLRPIQSSGTNGKKPALCLRYWQAEEQKDYTHLIEELKFRLVPAISNDYYLKNLSVYETDRPYVLALNEYLKHNRHFLETSVAVNERSFEIWNREKFLTKEQGIRILKCCNVSTDTLNYYGTSEPLAYYTHTRAVPQNIVIVENKDTFYSMRRHLLEGNQKILGEKIGTIIYGAGKGILRSYQDFELCAEPYMKELQNKILYFGDMDYEGILIYERLAKIFPEAYSFSPFVQAYAKMLKKAENIPVLPKTKEGQNRNIGTGFFTYFEAAQKKQMEKILESGFYIPQEILNIVDF